MKMEILSLAHASRPPAAVVLEADRELILAADPAPRGTGETFAALEAAAARAPCYSPGTVVVRGARPARMLAIVHDLDRDPTWREDWIAAALRCALAEARDRGLEDLALPLLGTVHGRLPGWRAIRLLAAAVNTVGPAGVRTLWVDSRDPGVIPDLLARLRVP